MPAYGTSTVSSPELCLTEEKWNPSLPEQIISDQTGKWFQLVNFVVICELVDIFGVVANIINIICICKQGFQDSVNISLLGLAVSDLGCLVPLIWHNLCYYLLIESIDTPFETLGILYLTGCWPHATFNRVTSCITAFITLERCLCVTVPLKVKSLLTPKRVTAIIICLFVVLMGSAAPVFCANRLSFEFIPERNKTLLALVYSPDREKIERVSFLINNVTIPFGAFVTIIICTTILVTSLRKKTRWRKTSVASSKSEAFSSRDEKISQMVVMISVLFIVCFIPVSILFIVMVVWPPFSLDGSQRNIFIVMFSFAFILESANSAMNIFIYYRMSSKYRRVFRRLFCLDSNRDEPKSRNLN